MNHNPEEQNSENRNVLERPEVEEEAESHDAENVCILIFYVSDFANPLA